MVEYSSSWDIYFANNSIFTCVTCSLIVHSPLLYIVLGLFLFVMLLFISSFESYICNVRIY